MDSICNYRLLLPYAAPYFAYVAVATFLRALPPEWNYALRIVVVVGLLIWAWRWYMPLTGPGSTVVSVAWGAVAGVAGTVLWVALLTPFTAGEGEYRYKGVMLKTTLLVRVSGPPTIRREAL